MDVRGVYFLRFILPGSFSYSENLFSGRTENSYCYGLGRLKATGIFSEAVKEMISSVERIAGF